ncbi:MAG: mannan-binding lectin, partial [Desulfovibrio sp.]
MDARQAAFLEAARIFVDGHILPDGTAIDKDDLTGNFSGNELAVCDVDGDGQPELLVRFQSGTEASKQEQVCGYDERSGKITVQFTGVPGVEYYSNGCLKQKFSHNQGLGGAFWPYSFLMLDAEKGGYVAKGSVDAWSLKAFPRSPFEEDKPFPKKVDATGDGFVYFIDDEGFAGARGLEEPVDTPVYEAWVRHYTGGAGPVKVQWFPADADGITALAELMGVDVLPEGAQGMRIDVEAGPIWDNDHAKERCPEVLAGLLASNPGSRAEWTGHWTTTVWGEMSVCNFLIRKPLPHGGAQGMHVDVEAGPIWDNDHAKERCPEVLAGLLASNPG